MSGHAPLGTAKVVGMTKAVPSTVPCTLTEACTGSAPTKGAEGASVSGSTE